jgi:prevent-host-death family protein
VKTWQVQDAKQRFSELVQRALDEGPQLVTRRGKVAVVVLAADEYQHLTGGRSQLDFKAYLASAPDLSLLDLDAFRRDMPRPVDL